MRWMKTGGLVVSGLAALMVLSLAVWLWGLGGADQIAAFAAQAQREAQGALARGLRALKAGQDGAYWALLSICFAYGFFHAAGPGHGKLVIGGYGLGRRVALWRLSGLALVSSLAQAGTAVLLVLAGAQLFDWGRERMSDLADQLLAPVSYGLMGLLGLYLLARGARRVLRMRRKSGADHGDAQGHHAHADAYDGDHHGHSHHHGHNHESHHDHHHEHDAHGQSHAPGAVCETCGHRHAPTLEEAENLSSWREALAIVLAIAARPCTGAIFLLLLTWRLEILPAGIAGAFAMGLGTAVVTVLVALLATVLRGGILARWAPGALSADAGARIAAMLEMTAGAMVALLCLQLMLRSF